MFHNKYKKPAIKLVVGFLSCTVYLLLESYNSL